MSADELREAKREAHVEATLFVLVAIGLLVVLGLLSVTKGWKLVGLPGWIWFALAGPHVVLFVALWLARTTEDHERGRRLVNGALWLVVAGNVAGLALLVAGLLTEKSTALTGAQLLTSGATLWATNVIVFGLWFWRLDAGGPIRRALHGRATPDFQFPQDENPQLKRPGWYPRLEDYVYIALTNGVAFSPTDAMPLTRSAKTLMGMDAMISVVTLLLVAARAVNVLP